MGVFGAVIGIETMTSAEPKRFEVHDTIETLAILYPGKTIEQIGDDLGQHAFFIQGKKNAIFIVRTLCHGGPEAAEEVSTTIEEELKTSKIRSAEDVIDCINKAFPGKVVGSLSEIPSVILKVEY